MKTIFIFLASIFLFCFCQNSPQKDKTETFAFPEDFLSKYRQKVAEELEKAKTRQENQLLLGFELGMSREEYKLKFEELIQQHKLKPLLEFKENSKFVSSSADTTDFFYPLEIANEFYPLHFVSTFKNEKLSGIFAKIDTKVGEKKTENLYENLVKMYIKKYGKDYLEKINMYKPNDFIWLNANRQIKLSVSFSSIQIDYSQLSTTDIEFQQGEKIKEENNSSSLEDI